MKEIFTEKIPQFFTKTVPAFFSLAITKIKDVSKKCWDAVCEFFSGVRSSANELICKITKKEPAAKATGDSAKEVKENKKALPLSAVNTMLIVILLVCIVAIIAAVRKPAAVDPEPYPTDYETEYTFPQGTLEYISASDLEVSYTDDGSGDGITEASESTSADTPVPTETQEPIELYDPYGPSPDVEAAFGPLVVSDPADGFGLISKLHMEKIIPENYKSVWVDVAPMVEGYPNYVFESSLDGRSQDEVRLDFMNNLLSVLREVSDDHKAIINDDIYNEETDEYIENWVEAQPFTEPFSDSYGLYEMYFTVNGCNYVVSPYDALIEDGSYYISYLILPVDSVFGEAQG